MATFKTLVEDVEIMIKTNSTTGREIVYYDGEVVSDKKSHLFLTAHSWNVKRGKRMDVYEVNVIAGVVGQGFIIRKNGVVLAHQP